MAEKPALEQVLSGSPGFCPAYEIRLIHLLRMCPLQVEAIRTLEGKFGAVDAPGGFHVNIFVPHGGGMAFGCAHYKAAGKQVSPSQCPLEVEVVDQLVQLTL